jgi:hypothetical protein
MTAMTNLYEELTGLLTQVDSSVGLSNTDMADLGGYLNQLRQMAKDAGNKEALRLVRTIWDKAQAVHRHTAEVNVQSVAIAQVAITAIAQRDELGNELEELIEAIEEAESLEDWVWPKAYANVHADMIERVHTMTGCGRKAAEDFVSRMMGRHAPFSAYQNELFCSFMATFAEQSEAVAQ